MKSKCANSGDSGESSQVLSRAGLMKVFMSIDRNLVREAERNNKVPTNLSELDQVVTEILRSDLSESDVSLIASGNKMLVLPGEVTPDVLVKTTDIVSATAKAVEAVTVLPEKSKVEIALKILGEGPVAKIFVYSFIPSDSEILAKYPRVAEKRKMQLETLQSIADAISFPVEYVKKHIRNGIVEHYGTNPEQILHDIANRKDSELTGLGKINLDAIINGINAVTGVVNAFKGGNQPSASDYPTPASSQTSPSSQQPQVVVIPPQQNVTNDPAYDKDKEDNTLLYVGLGVLGLGVVGVGAYVLAKN